MSPWSGFRSLDGFGRTIEDVRLRTHFGGWLTIVSFILIGFFSIAELYDYRRIRIANDIIVDRSRGEQITINLNVTFPRVPCYLMSVDIMDISGQHQNDLHHHSVIKTRLSATGDVIAAPSQSQLKGDLARVIALRGENYCGDCYGGVAPESGCCQDCEAVRESYVKRGWSFHDPSSIDQCVQEGWSEKIQAQAQEGCNVAGKVRVNKVIGNFHLSPGRSFQSNAMHVHDLVPYLKSDNHHDFGHIIHFFSFGGAEYDTSDEKAMVQALVREETVRKKVGIVNPLDGIRAHTEKSNYMFQYLVKVVATDFVYLSGERVSSHQYSVTSYERNLDESEAPGKDSHGHMQSHGVGGVPGVFFNYEISPLKVEHKESTQTFAHFITSTCAIVGGVLTVAGIIDGLYFGARKKFGGKNVEGFAGLTGKML